MRYSPRNIRVAFNHAGLTHYGGAFFLYEFVRVLQIRHFLARHLHWDRRNHRYSLAQMVLALAWPLILGLDRIETASLLRSNGTFQFLTGLQSFPDAQTLRRFLTDAPIHLAQQLRDMNDRLLQLFTHEPHPRSRLILDFDSTVLTVFGHQQGAAIGYNPRHRGRRSYQPLLCVEAGSAHLWGTFLRPGNTDPHAGTVDLFQDCWASLPLKIREIRLRADAGFFDGKFLDALDDAEIHYAVVAKIYAPLQRRLSGLSYQRANSIWEMAECDHQPFDWPEARRFTVARRLLEEDSTATLFTMGRYQYRCWVSNLPLRPQGIWHFYDGRAAIEARIRELRYNFAYAHIPTQSFSANALYMEVIRFAYNLVTAFQRLCLPSQWQSFNLQTLRQKLFFLPAELTRPQNRPVLRLHRTPDLEQLSHHILTAIKKIRPLP